MKQMPVESFWPRCAGRSRARCGAPRSCGSRPGKQRARQLRLVQAVQEVALVLGPVQRLEQLELAAAAGRRHLAHARVVAGGDVLGAQRHGVVQEGLELDLGIAQHVGIGRAAGGILAQELGEDAVLVFGGEIDVFEFHADQIGDAGRVQQILAGGAVFGIVVVFPVLHEQADDLVALLLEQPGGDRRIDPPDMPTTTRPFLVDVWLMMRSF